MVSSLLVSGDRSGHDESDGADTPPTRSYIDALLHGSMTEHEFSAVRAEIAGADVEISGDGEDEDDADRTRFHSYTVEERKSARPDADADEDDEDQTRFHSYTIEERKSARPVTMGGAPPYPPADEDDEDQTRFHAYTIEERKSARPEANEDDVRAFFRPPSRQPPSGPVSSDLAPRSAPPVSSDRGARSAPPVSSDRGARSAPPPVSSDRGVRSAPPPVSSDRAPRSQQPASARTPDPLLEMAPSSAPGLHIDQEVPISVPTPRSYDARAIDQTYLEALGGAGSVPRLVMSPSQMTSLKLHHQAGFLVSLIDGQSTIDDLIDISGLNRLDTLRILYELQQQSVISVARR